MLRYRILVLVLVVFALPLVGVAADAVDIPVEPFTWKRFIHMIKAGGITMYPLGALSVGAIAYIIERFVRLRKHRLAPEGLGDKCRELWTAGDFDGLIAVAKNSGSALGKAIQVLVTYRDKPMVSVVQSANDVANSELLPHIRQCKPLIIIATTAPLLGLFGTILGMMGAFNKFSAIGNAGGDPSTFAGNISEALITAATGLIIAAISLFSYHVFKNRALQIGDELEGEINVLAMEWLLSGTGTDPLPLHLSKSEQKGPRHG
jgi:biopolymer transport protein ExbB